MEIAGHVDQLMLRHYSHIRIQAKREALEGVIRTEESILMGLIGLQQKRSRDI